MGSLTRSFIMRIRSFRMVYMNRVWSFRSVRMLSMNKVCNLRSFRMVSMNRVWSLRIVRMLSMNAPPELHNGIYEYGWELQERQNAIDE